MKDDKNKKGKPESAAQEPVKEPIVINLYNLPALPQSQKNSEKEKIPQREQEYWAYVYWKSLPAMLRKLSVVQLTDMGFNPDMISMMQIKTNTDFAAQFGVSRDSLTAWKQLERFPNDVRRMIDNSIVSTYKSAVDHKFTLMTLQHGDAPRVKLWKQIYEGYTDKSETIIDHRLNINIRHKIIVGDDMSSAEIMNLVILKVAKRGGIDIPTLMKSMNTSFYADDNKLAMESGAVIVDKKLPSDFNYNFDDIAIQNEAPKAEVVVSPKERAEKLDAQTKERMKEKLKELNKDMGSEASEDGVGGNTMAANLDQKGRNKLRDLLKKEIE